MIDLITSIRNWRNKLRSEQWSQKLRQINDTFQVKELDGTIYLMCDGVPYKEINKYASAEEITRLLSEARSASMKYHECKANGSVKEI